MAFLFNVNLSPAQHNNMMFEIKEQMKLAGWTVESSGYAITAPVVTSAYSAVGDVITAASILDFTAGTLWWRIRQPTISGGDLGAPGGREFVFHTNGSSNAASWRFKYAVSVPFTGGSPGTGQPPSSTDEVIVWGGGTDAAPTYAQLFGFGLDGTYRLELMAENVAPFGWYAATFTNGGTNPADANLFFDPMLLGSELQGDPDPYVFCVIGGNPWSRIGAQSATGDGANAWFGKGTPSQFFGRCPVPAYFNVTAGQFVPGGAGSNPYTLNDDLFPLYYIRKADIGRLGGYKGMSRYFKWMGTERQIGCTLTVVTPKDYMVLVDMAIVWNGSDPTI
jgi:hypothetical protein